MSHLVFAGIFCTIAMVMLAWEMYRNEALVSSGFLFFYGLGTLVWNYLAWRSDMSLLVVISTVQLFSVLLVWLLGFNRSAR